MLEATEGIVSDLKPARVLYTGTGEKYLREKLRLFREFRHLGKDIYLDESPLSACGYALQRAEFYGDSPVLLIVDSQRLKEDLYYDGRYKTRSLPLDSFLPFELSLDAQEKVQEEDYHCIIQIEEMILKASEQDIRREIARFLSLM